MNILNRAREGLYNNVEIKNVDREILDKYFIQYGDKFKIKDDIKRLVTFKRHDLIKDRYDTGFDLIVCRNVVIYFTQEVKNEIYKKFYNSLKDGGLLFVGATESIYNYRELGFDKVATFIYKKVRR